jgi:hypothetical protein
MNGNLEPKTSGTGTAAPADGPRTGFLLMVLVIAAAVIGGGIFFRKKGQSSTSPEQTAQADETPKAVSKHTAKTDPDVMPEPNGTALPPASVNPNVTARTQAASTTPAVPKPEPSPYTRSLVKALAEIDLKNGPMTPEKAEAWKAALAQLKQQGAAGVPAILEYMEKNTDISFDALGVSKDLGSSSVRMALLESLGSLGSEGIAPSLQVLQTTTDPREIAYLAGSLDAAAPEQYRQEILRAARDTIGMAGENKLPGVDVGALFDTLKKYGGPGAVADLEGLANNYRYYSLIALGTMPDNAGVNSLISMATDPNNPNKSARNPALQMLAQLAPQSPEAQTALLNEIKADSIPYATWVTIADVLGGGKFYIGNPSTMGGNQPGDKTWHLPGGNQSFYLRPDPTMTPEQAQQNINFINQALANTKNQAAQELLQRSLGQLQGRVGK